MQSAEERFKGIRKIGVDTHIFEDMYHRVMIMSWRMFFLYFCLFFLIFNFAFALIYFYLPNGINGTDGSLFQHFSFSVETFSTVGYGTFSPQSDIAHLIMIIQSMSSVLFTALFTGLAFAKFSRTSAKVVFSNNVLISEFDGHPCLIIRLGNLRGNQIIEASIRLVALVSHTTKEGVFLRQQVDLPLIRNFTTFFTLSWTVIHRIDEQSPFYGKSLQQIKDEKIDLAVSMTGHDETVSQRVYANCFYAPDDYVFGKHFVDIISINNGRVDTIDYSRFNDLK